MSEINNLIIDFIERTLTNLDYYNDYILQIKPEDTFEVVQKINSLLGIVAFLTSDYKANSSNQSNSVIYLLFNNNVAFINLIKKIYGQNFYSKFGTTKKNNLEIVSSFFIDIRDALSHVIDNKCFNNLEIYSRNRVIAGIKLKNKNITFEIDLNNELLDDILTHIKNAVSQTTIKQLI